MILYINKSLYTILNNKSFIKKFKKSASVNEYEEGTVYDPNNGKTYCAKLTLNGKELKLHGFICGFTWLGRNTTWTLVD